MLQLFITLLFTNLYTSNGYFRFGIEMPQNNQLNSDYQSEESLLFHHQHSSKYHVHSILRARQFLISDGRPACEIGEVVI